MLSWVTTGEVVVVGDNAENRLISHVVSINIVITTKRRDDNPQKKEEAHTMAAATKTKKTKATPAELENAQFLYSIASTPEQYEQAGAALDAAEIKTKRRDDNPQKEEAHV